MALKKFSQFSTKTSLTDSDYTVGYNGSTNYKWTLINLYNYIKSKLDSVYLKLTGGELSGGLEFSNSLGTAVRSYVNVVNYHLTNAQIGAIVITHPKGFNNTMNAIKVIGYDLEVNKYPFEMTLGGYQSYGLENWERVKAIGDNVYFDRVRVGYNASAGKCVIILGDVNTKWYYTFFSISLIAAYGNYTGLTSGWNVELVTDLSPYTKIVDVPLFLNGVNYTGAQLTASGNSLTIDYSDGYCISYTEVQCGGVAGTLNVTVNNVQIGSKIKLMLYDTDNITALNLTVNALLPSGTTTVCDKIVENWQVGGSNHVVSIDGYYMVGSAYKVFVNLGINSLENIRKVITFANPLTIDARAYGNNYYTIATGLNGTLTVNVNYLQEGREVTLLVLGYKSITGVTVNVTDEQLNQIAAPAKADAYPFAAGSRAYITVKNVGQELSIVKIEKYG